MRRVSMAKILILANDDVGLYKFRKELIQELINRGNKIYIALPEGDWIHSFIEMGCTFINTVIERRGINPLSDFKLLLHYSKILEKVKPDVVISYTVKPNIYGGIMCGFKKVPYAMNITGLGTAFQGGGILENLIIALYKISCKKVGVVFFENEENQRNFIDKGIVKKEDTCKLNGAGVNLEEYTFCDYPEENRELHFLFIGRVMKEKGIDELFEAAKSIRKDYKNVFFDIVGPLEENYKGVIENLEEKKIINYYGYHSDIKKFIDKTHCFILPSYHEGMANTLLESGAMGRPLITSSIHGCKEAVIDEVTGYLVNVKDSNDLYLKICEFKELPYTEKVKMGNRSRKHVETIFNRDDVIKTSVSKLKALFPIN
jgi:galacturonosyltransferase